MRTFYLLFLLIYLCPLGVFAQEDSIREIKGIPTKQIYDLMIDSKGFLWIGHDLGLSRFDGTSFTHFSNSEQSSLAVGDLVEDNTGRVWCRNFSSEIFYVENEKMNLLAGYDHKTESTFPRLLILGNNLISSSSHGLFVCNTSNLHSRYIKCGNNSQISSIAIVNNKIIAFGVGKWYIYDPKSISGLSQLKANSKQDWSDSIYLQPYSFKDTIYSFSYISGFITKLLVKNNMVEIVGKIKSGGFMNTINPSGIDTWIHTKAESQTVDGAKHILGYNLTDLVVDKEGNTWYSSFKYGLLVKPKYYWKKINIIDLAKDDIITKYYGQNEINIYGTQKAVVILQSSKTNKIIKKFAPTENAGPIEYINAVDSLQYIISSSLRIFLLNKDLKYLEKISSGLILKDISITNNSIFLATSTGLYEFRKSLSSNFKTVYDFKLVNNQRCRSVAYDQINKRLIAVLKDGVYEISNGKSVPILYKGSQIHGTTVKLIGSSFYIATFGQGIFKVTSSGITKLSGIENYEISTIFKIKVYNNRLWMLGPGFLQIMDIKTEKPAPDLVIPAFPNADIYDFAVIENRIVLFTSSGVYELNSSNVFSDYKITNYLVNVSVNGINLSENSNISLPYDKNNIDFLLSVPFYTDPDKISFKYRLQGGSDEQWKFSYNKERIFRYSSLSSGHYKFEAFAIHPQFGIAEKPIQFEFKILPPWYQTWLFKIFITILAGGLIYALYRYRIVQILRVEKLRSKLSKDLHDDIGATLSSINIYSELAKNDENNKEYLNTIQLHTQEIISNLDDLVWSINPKNDTMEQLIERMISYAVPFLKAKNINCVIARESENTVEITLEQRNTLYLAFKEIVNNVAKHSNCSQCWIQLLQKGKSFRINVKDDGKGFDIIKINKQRNGLTNLKERAKENNGCIEIVSAPGKGCSITFGVNIK